MNFSVPAQSGGTDLNALRKLPPWLSDIEGSLAIRTHSLLSGNTQDLYAVSAGGHPAFLPLVDALWHMLELRGFRALVVFDPVAGAVPHPGCPPLTKAQSSRLCLTQHDEVVDLDALLRLINAAAAERQKPVAVVVDYASQLLASTGRDPADKQRFLVALHKLARTSAQAEGVGSPVFWVLDQPGDLPDWFAVNNPSVGTVVIGLPDQEDRLAFAEQLLEGSEPVEPNERRDKGDPELFALHAEGMTLRTMQQVARLAEAEGIGRQDIDKAVRAYNIGTPRNPWRSRLMRSRIEQGQEILTKRVKGQTTAVARTLEVLVRASLGLSAAQTSSRHTRPRGILFFAGPTGVGKTELAKSVTELLFGDETAYRRFDMSEFLNERSETRLIGAPPGAPGHEAGGELVNAVRAHPFGVFLFDEIEKAHPRVLDLFLQVLDEGRLTDARGETAHFSESLLIFTSNIGIIGSDNATNMGLRVLPGDSHEELETKIIKGVSDHFRFTLQRPELMNRLGQNIVVFDFIRASGAGAIFDALLDRVLQAVWDEHQTDISMLPEVYERLRELCTQDLFEGGRGIGNRLETAFVNPLSRLLFEAEGENDVTITGLDISEATVVLRTD